MGVYSEYLDNLHDIESVTRERKKQLGRIASIRGRSVLAMASDIAKDRIQSSNPQRIVTRDGHMVLATNDGRQPHMAPGLPLTE